jgi:hypothetical protein
MLPLCILFLPERLESKQGPHRQTQAKYDRQSSDHDGVRKQGTLVVGLCVHALASGAL